MSDSEKPSDYSDDLLANNSEPSELYMVTNEAADKHRIGERHTNLSVGQHNSVMTNNSGINLGRDATSSALYKDLPI